MTMLLASSPAGTPAPLDMPSRLHAVLVFPAGGVDFDCPHVDARADERPLYYDEEPLSVWALADGGRERLELGGLHDLTGARIDPWPVLEQEIYLSDMLKRDEGSLAIADIHRLTLQEAVRRCPGGAAAAEAVRVCCTRDLLVLDARLADGGALRPRLADLRGCVDPLATRLGEEDVVLPVFDRGAGPVPPGGPERFLRRRSVAAQMRALLQVALAPNEVVVGPQPCA